MLLICLHFLVNAQIPHCVEHPDDQECVDFKLPDVRAHIDQLCGMMWMSGCTVDSICSNDHYNNSQTMHSYCSEISVMVDICDDMPMGVDGCSHWDSMCKPDNTESVVKQCKTPVLSNVLPFTIETKNLVADICNTMPMDGCEKCKQDDQHCDFLEVYGHLCIQMPDMSQCSKWHSLCEVVPDWPICGGSDHDHNTPPTMRMYFHMGIKDYVLFKEWVPTTSLAYFGTWVAVFVIAIIFDGIKFIRSRLEKRWAQSALRLGDNGVVIEDRGEKFRPSVDFFRSSLQALETLWGYAVMLIAMTFNVGLFLAVVAGSFVGTMLFGRFIVYQAKASCH